MPRIIRAGPQDYEGLYNQLLEERKGLALYASNLLGQYTTTFKQPDFWADNEHLLKEEKILDGCEEHLAQNHRIFFRGEVFAREYGTQRVLEAMPVMQSVHREHDAVQRLYVAKGCHDLQGLDFALLVLTPEDGDPGVPGRMALAIHHEDLPVFTGTSDVGITTIGMEPKIVIDAGYEWKEKLDAIWKQYLDSNPLKTREDFNRKHGYR